MDINISLDHWVIIEPGLINLNTTGIFIRHSKEDNTYQIYWHSKKIGGYSYTLDYTKSQALNFANEMHLMGYEL